MSARASLPSPSPEEVRAPVARACASCRPRERALSAARALAVLRHPPAPAPAAAPPPPPTFCRRRHSQPFPPLSSSVLAFCRSSGKRRNSEIRSPSAPVHHPPAAPRPRDGFRELGIRQAQRRGAPLRPRRYEAGRERVQEIHARGRVRISMCAGVLTIRSAQTGARGSLCPQGGARMAVT